MLSKLSDEQDQGQYCSKCGAWTPKSGGHTCDPVDLASIEREEAEDQAVRDSGNGE